MRGRGLGTTDAARPGAGHPPSARRRQGTAARGAVAVEIVVATAIIFTSNVTKAVAEALPVKAMSPALIAQDPKWGFTLFAGASAGDDRLIELLASPWKADFRDDYFVGGAVSYRLVRFWKYFTIEPEVGVGRRFGQTNTPEVWGAIYLRYDGFLWNNYVYTTIGFSTGLDYLWKLPPSETHGGPTSHLLHYFSPEISFALPSHKQHELLFRYHHRSGVFGTFNNVWGGSNVMSVGLRYRF